MIRKLLFLLCVGCLPVMMFSQGRRDTRFYVSMVPDSVFALMQGRSYHEGCPVRQQDLRIVHCLIVDAQGVTRKGEMMLHKKIAGKVAEIFRKLYEARYPIARMELIDHYGGDDELSMRANNSSGFNYRKVKGSKRVSKHGLGLAVDVNTRYNPYYKRYKDGREVVQPSTSRKYLHRGKAFPYKIVKGDLCWRLFTQAGFRWGGSWRTVKDYQHFEY